MTQPIDLAIQQLYENEALTDACTDEPAKRLLSWGETQLRATTTDDAEAIDALLNRLQRTMRSINRLVERRADLSETEFVEQLLKLTERSMQLGSLLRERKEIPPS